MRLIAAIMTLIALAAAGFAGQQLHGVLTAPDAPTPALNAANAALEAPVEATAENDGFRWPNIFGELQAPTFASTPAQPSQETTAPEAAAPAGPPLDALGFALKGVVRAGNSFWGMVSHPAGDRIVRVNDELAAGVIVRRIDETGLWVDNGSDELVLFGFARKDAPAE